jgi:hypothetical protein
MAVDERHVPKSPLTLKMRYRLRTLLIVLALGPAVLAGIWSAVAQAHRPRLQGCFGQDLGPAPMRIVIQEEDEAKLGIGIEL